MLFEKASLILPQNEKGDHAAAHNVSVHRIQRKSLKNKDDDKLQDGNKQYLTSLFVYYMAMIYCQ